MRTRPRHPLTFAVAIVGLATVLTASAPQPAKAQQLSPPVKEGSKNEAILPIYNPHTKSYFELRIDLPKPPNWLTANKFAKTRTYKGVRGRRAIVKDVETHSFLHANFHLNEEAWIGMRFLCSVRKLVWVTGDEQKRKEFSAWARSWHRTNVTCRTNRMAFMPVYYQPTRDGFRWQASGQQKYFGSVFVEYPTGKP
jgi:hypothetical protein